MKSLLSIFISFLVLQLCVSCGEDSPLKSSITNSTELDFHSPASIALVSVNDVSANKASEDIKLDEGVELCSLYEITGDGLQLVRSKKGKEIYFSGVDEIISVTNEWKIILDYHYYHNADMKIYKEGLLSTSSESIKSVLINTVTGELHNIDEYINLNESIYYTNCCDAVDYNSDSNFVYFNNDANEICKIDLNDLSMEKFALPYNAGEEEVVWREIDGNIFFLSREGWGNFYIYKPNQGLITKTNANLVGPGYIPYLIWQSDSGTFLSSDFTYFVGSEHAVDLLDMSKVDYFNYLYFKITVRNDSIIFSPRYAALDEESDPPNISPDYFFRIGKSFSNSGRTWNKSKRCIWSLDEASETYQVLRVVNAQDQKITSNGEDHFSLYENKIYHYDLNSLSYDLLVEIEDFDVKRIRPGIGSSVFAHGRRYSDLQDVVVEYEGETGAKLNEWVLKEAPATASIVCMTEKSN